MKRDKSELIVYIICPTCMELDERLTKAEHDIREFIAKNGYKEKNDYNIRVLRPNFDQTKFRISDEYVSGPIVYTPNHLRLNFEALCKSDVIWLCDGWEENNISLAERIHAKIFDKNILNPMCDSVFAYHKLNNSNDLLKKIHDKYTKFQSSIVIPSNIFKFMEEFNDQVYREAIMRSLFETFC